MNKYRLSNAAKEDLIRIHHYGVNKFGVKEADRYFDSFFKYFDIIAQRPFSFESVDYIKKGYRRCVCGSDSIYFKVNNNIVEIMAIVGRQDLNNVFSD
ncbi:MAG: type II toxin-antitoxin system RelE/ParE family toxin [Ignavibacteriae bacterium]|nr:type II toxin-antitoxin system RelE/ParE family toxin [Ignavibacteriota bacterium]NOH00064.1 type II toxin-antitoxin system RelE/ParE family toxin [Ignavibacteriota bacterium]